MTTATNTNHPTWLRSRLVLVESTLRRVLMALPGQSYPSAALDDATAEASTLLFGEQLEDRPHGQSLAMGKCGCEACESWDWAQAVENKRWGA